MLAARLLLTFAVSKATFTIHVKVNNRARANMRTLEQNKKAMVSGVIVILQLKG
jgi:hypothetical protein